ncbi:DUF4012 domain-containing protein [Nakamurella sp. YIM 132087]|uniref:DUF4012 domain-containing protein n=1 Tax=Nakamurella alba TaxID=2665158 RepID=A0A7K1FF57_9ACTN|nr:DUF4012 domain-containing protein [Nakamurella alba]MTD12737.1 DUF4012 domain-containing protein [Nakamurella alba]
MTDRPEEVDGTGAAASGSAAAGNGPVGNGPVNETPGADGAVDHRADDHRADDHRSDANGADGPAGQDGADDTDHTEAPAAGPTTTASTPVPASTRSGRRARSRRRKIIGRSLMGLGLLVLLAGGWVAWRSYQAYSHLQAAADKVSEIRSQVRDLDNLDAEQLRTSVAQLQQDSADAVSATSDPVYRLATVLPWLGTNLDAVSEIAHTVDDLATGTAPGLVDVAGTLDPATFAPKDGAVDLGPLVQAAPTLQAADDSVRSASARVGAIPRSGLVSQVADAVDQLQAQLTELGSTTAAAARLGRLVPPMLGADGPRTYLVVFENLAEPRATGGIFGSYAALTFTDGKFTLSGQGSASRDLGEFEPPVAVTGDVPDALYQGLIGRFATDVNLTPDFPTAASTISEMYTERTGTAVDGVLSVDPVALSYLMKGIPPIDLGNNITIDAENLTETLLSKAYTLYPDIEDGDARDVFLAAATARVFSTVTSSVSGDVLLRGVLRGTQEHRVMLWSSHPDEQQDLAATPVAGDFPGGGTGFGVFRNDGTGGKLGYYASGDVTLAPGGCGAGGRDFTLTTHLVYDAPASGLPDYVLGYEKAGPYVLRTNILVFGAAGAELTSLTVDGKEIPVVAAEQDGRSVLTATVDQKPGTDTNVVVSGTWSGDSAPGPTHVTPGVGSWDVTDAELLPCP